MENFGTLYRPRGLNEMVGNAQMRRKLWADLKADTLGHCILFCGSSGLGKTTITRIMAALANCENPKGGAPCGECAACTDPVVIEHDCGKEGGKADIERVVDSVSMMRPIYKRNVVILDEVHALTGQALKVLLKATEDDTNTLWLLATDTPSKLPVTLKGRGQMYTLLPPSKDEFCGLIDRILEAETLDLSDEALDALYESYGGNIRMALNSLQAGTLVTPEEAELAEQVLVELISAMLRNHAADMVVAIHRFSALSATRLVDNIQMLRQTLDALLLRAASRDAKAWLPETAKLLLKDKSLSKLLDAETLMLLTLAVSEGERAFIGIALSPSAERSVFASAVALFLHKNRT